MTQSLTSPIEFTYEDYCNLPEDKRYEIIEGKIHMVPAPVPFHQRVSRRISLTIESFVSKNNLGEIFYSPIDVVLSETNVIQPDIVFISKDKLSIIGEKYIEGAPDLVIEILSPSTEQKDRTMKLKLYNTFGVKEYWIASPQGRTIEKYTLQELTLQLTDIYTIQQILTSELLPGLKLNIKDIFE
jgi:Uma2 family endonuclease